MRETSRPHAHVPEKRLARSVPVCRRYGRIGAGGMRGAPRNPAVWLVLALLPALSGCGAVATVGSTVFSTSEAIATAVKDAIKKPDENSVGPADE